MLKKLHLRIGRAIAGFERLHAQFAIQIDVQRLTGRRPIRQLFIGQA
jgi:hypothetical protein